MKPSRKFVRWLPFSLITFGAGAAIVTWLAISHDGDATNPQPPSVSSSSTLQKVEDSSCAVALAYPGRSVDISSIPRSPKGYFPRALADRRDRNFDPSQNEWYGKFLKAVNERSLLGTQNSDDLETYRFIWLRTFHHPIVVSVTRQGFIFKLVSQETDGVGGYEPGKPFRTDKKAISKEEWCRFNDLLNGATFWSMPSVEEDDGGNDGSQWILEGVRGARYHVVDRWTPTEGTFRNACLYLLVLSGRDVEKMGNDLY